MQISRLIQKDIINHLQPNKVVVIYGPRRVGKTTLIQEINKKFFNKTLF
ncbi:AAA family ATPase, partial [Candidatus Roizmanbacteria bacterium]|nr:AAA family ATPase [Candidatus Roizmanbacteria bacterium]